ncbi:hypothetical protein LEMLEM_LOCUS26587 [Lemmus lemmus]
MLLDIQNSGLKQALFFFFVFLFVLFCFLKMHFIVSLPLPPPCLSLSTGAHCEVFAVQHWDGMGRWPSAKPCPVCQAACVLQAPGLSAHPQTIPHLMVPPQVLWQHREDPRDSQHPLASPAASGGAPAGSSPLAATGAGPESCFGDPGRSCCPAASLRYPLPPSSEPGEADAPPPPGTGPPSGTPLGCALSAPSLYPVGGVPRKGWLPFKIAIQQFWTVGDLDRALGQSWKPGPLAEVPMPSLVIP